MSERVITRSTIPEDYVAVERSEICPWSKDNSLLVLQHAGGKLGLYSGDGAFTYLLPPPLRHSSEPRWSRQLPGFYYLEGSQIRYWSETASGSIQYAEFREYVSIRGCGESDLSQDSSHLVVAGKKKDGSEEVFVFSLIDGKGPVFPVVGMDGLKISSANSAIVSRAEGIFAYDVGRTDTRRKLTNANGHAAVGTYKNRPVLLWCNSNDPTPLQGFENAVVMVDIKSGKPTGLKSFPWPYAYHISACDQGWCAVSAYDDPRSPVTKGLPNQIWRVPFDGSPSTLEHEWQSPYHPDFQPRASLSRDGSRMVWNVWNGATCNVSLKVFGGQEVVNPPILPPPPPPPKITGWIDYSPWVGKKYWIMRPRKDGALDIIEMDEKHGNN